MKPWPWLFVALYACQSSAPAGRLPPAGPPASAPPASAPPASAPTSKEGGGDSDSASGAPAASPACDPPRCRLFDTPQAALSAVLDEKPLVLGVGEAHVLKGAGHIESTIHRFGQTLLPAMGAERVSDVVLELLEPDPSCLERAAEVEKEQKQVTEGQAATNQNEYVAFGYHARELGIVPHILETTCDDYRRILTAGDDSILEMLKMIRRQTEDKVKRLLKRNEQRGDTRLIVTYGGAMHNDLSPRKGHAEYSYGPSLSELTGGRYVELDLIVREFIKENETWRALPWFSEFDRSRAPNKVTLLEPAPGSFVLIFAASNVAAAEAGGDPRP